MSVSGEFELLARLKPLLAFGGPRLPVGAGDDAAVVDITGTPVAFAIDALVDGIHVDRDISSLDDVGYKALAVNISDLAAVGATCRAAVVGLQRPADLDDDEVIELYRGLDEAATCFGVDVVGGDIVSGPVLAVSVAVIGPLLGDTALRRDGAQVGDAVIVVGSLGLAAAGLELHRSGRTELLDAYPELLAAHRRPEPLPAAAPVLVRAGAHACIDVSDGLGRDLGHVAEASGVGIRLSGAELPVAAGVAAGAEALGVPAVDLVSGGGEDLALAVTVAPDSIEDLAEGLAAVGLPGTRIGEVVAGDSVLLVEADGGERDVTTLGYEHGSS